MKMDELPELVIWLIIDHLNYEDVQNLRLTCKRLKAIIDQRRFESLHLVVREFPFERDLFGTNELVNYSNTLRINSLGILSSAKFKSQFSGLTKLTIYFDPYRDSEYSEKVTLNDLNSFVHLLHLEVLGLDLNNGKLDLPNLKIARFDNDKFHSPDFELNCPQLNALGLSKGTLPKLTPETRRSIQHLSMYVPRVNVLKPTYRSYELDLYDQLTNLSTVSFLDCEQAQRFVRDLIDRKVCAPSLKRIQLKDADYYSEPILESFIIFKSCKETRHIEFQINWKMMNLDGLIEIRDLIRRLDPERQPSLIKVSRFTHRALMPFAENSNFDCLIPSDSWLLFDCPKVAPFIGKLINLTELEIGEMVALAEGVFEALLRKGRRIRRLTIQSNHLTQQQLDRMPAYLTDLRVLNFDGDADLSEMNLDFITKFNLFSVTFCFCISKKTMGLILKRFKCEPKFHLGVHGAQIVNIYSLPNGRFQIVRRGLRVAPEGSWIKNEFVCLEDAIVFYYKNKLFQRKAK